MEGHPLEGPRTGAGQVNVSVQFTADTEEEALEAMSHWQLTPGARVTAMKVFEEPPPPTLISRPIAEGEAGEDGSLDLEPPGQR